MSKMLLVYISGLFLSFSGILTAQNFVNNTDNWFPFTPENIHDEGVISMNNWLDAPAGKHGFLLIKDEDLVFENGEKVKFWGTNICSRLPYSDADEADKFAAFLAKYGVNAVRFHKFSSHGYAENTSTQLSPEKYARFDYFQHKLKETGIYYGWSHIYGQRVFPGDSNKLVAYSEIKNLQYPWSHLNGTTSSVVNFAPDLQKLSILLTVNMLNHVNPHTGLRYADDPALAFIEFQNEDNIFWSAIERSLEQAPTYRAMLNKQFSKWLKKKYGNQKNLEKAWGKENIPDGESLEKENIYPQPSHGLFSYEYETATVENRPMATHILDKMRFLYETQMDFYKRFEKAIRKTGYKGVLVGSCWQAGSGLAHFYNLSADYEVGMIDRHNYFGGGAGGHRLAEGKVKNESMMKSPGSGLLSAGLQQVKDRPFSFSEWMSLVPNEWTAESDPIIAVYGMGLQGWDASFSFATDLPRFSRLLESERHGVYNATSPLHFGLYPVLARMIYRSDVAESQVVDTRNVHIPSLADGKLGFNEVVKQGFDDKSFSGTVTPEMLAVGKFPVDFTEFFKETNIPSVEDYWKKDEKTITSATGELVWKYDEDDYFTVNTKGTKALVGFAPNKKVELGDWTIETKNPFAVIFVTDLSKNGDLSSADKILVAAVSRGRNTGMRYAYNGDETVLTETGELPLLLEPVVATIASRKLEDYEVKILDQDGRLTGKSISISEGSFTINGQKDKTLYYLIIKK